MFCSHAHKKEIKMAYKDSFKNQNWLLPLSIKQMIPENFNESFF